MHVGEVVYEALKEGRLSLPMRFGVQRRTAFRSAWRRSPRGSPRRQATLERVIEPVPLRRGLVGLTPHGRAAT